MGAPTSHLSALGTVAQVMGGAITHPSRHPTSVLAWGLLRRAGRAFPHGLRSLEGVTLLKRALGLCEEEPLWL